MTWPTVADEKEKGPPVTSLSCPKCAGEMRGYERNSIQIEQCQECRGIFLDRGELERLIDAESRYLNTPQAPRANDLPGSAGERADTSRHGGKHGGGRRRKGGFFEELFD